MEYYYGDDEENNQSSAAYSDALNQYYSDLANYNAQMDQYNADLASYNAQMDQYNADMANYEAENQAYNQQLEDYNNQVNAYNTDYDQYQQDLANYDAQVNDYNNQLSSVDSYVPAVDEIQDPNSYSYQNDALNDSAFSYEEQPIVEPDGGIGIPSATDNNKDQIDTIDPETGLIMESKEFVLGPDYKPETDKTSYNYVSPVTGVQIGPDGKAVGGPLTISRYKAILGKTNPEIAAMSNNDFSKMLQRFGPNGMPMASDKRAVELAQINQQPQQQAQQGKPGQIPFQFEVQIDPKTGARTIRNLDIGRPIEGNKVQDEAQVIQKRDDREFLPRGGWNTPPNIINGKNGAGDPNIANKNNWTDIFAGNNKQPEQAIPAIDPLGMLTPQRIAEFKSKGMNAQQVAEELDTLYKMNSPRGAQINRFMTQEDFNNIWKDPSKSGVFDDGQSVIRPTDKFFHTPKSKLEQLFGKAPQAESGVAGIAPLVQSGQNLENGYYERAPRQKTDAEVFADNTFSKPISSKPDGNGGTIDRYRVSAQYPPDKGTTDAEMALENKLSPSALQSYFGKYRMKDGSLPLFDSKTEKEVLDHLFTDIGEDLRKQFGGNHRLVLKNDMQNYKPFFTNEILHIVNNDQLAKNNQVGYNFPAASGKDLTRYLTRDTDFSGAGGSFATDAVAPQVQQPVAQPQQQAVPVGQAGGDSGPILLKAPDQNKNLLKEDALFHRIKQFKDGHSITVDGKELIIPFIKSMPDQYASAKDFIVNLRGQINDAIPKPSLDQYAATTAAQLGIFDKLSSKDLELVKSFTKENSNTFSNKSGFATESETGQGTNATNSATNTGNNQNEFQQGGGRRGGNGNDGWTTNWQNGQQFARGANATGSRQITTNNQTKNGRTTDNTTGTGSSNRTEERDQRLAQLAQQSESAARAADQLLKMYDRSMADRENSINSQLQEYIKVSDAKLNAASDASKTGVASLGNPRARLDVDKVSRETGFEFPSGIVKFNKYANRDFVDQIKLNNEFNDALKKHFQSFVSGQQTGSDPVMANLNSDPLKATTQSLVSNILDRGLTSVPGKAPILKSEQDPSGWVGDRRNVDSVINIVSGQSGDPSVLSSPLNKLSERQAAEVSFATQVLDAGEYWSSKIFSNTKLRDGYVPKQGGWSESDMVKAKIPFGSALDMVLEETKMNPNSIQSKIRGMAGLEMIKKIYPQEFADIKSQYGLMDSIFGKGYNQRANEILNIIDPIDDPKKRRTGYKNVLEQNLSQRFIPR